MKTKNESERNLRPEKNVTGSKVPSVLFSKERHIWLPINQSINVYSPKQPTGFSNRRRLAEPLVDNIEICTGVDIYTKVNIIYRRYAQQVQEPQHDPPTQPGPTEINPVQEDSMKDPKQPAGRNHCTQPLPWQPIALCPLLQGTVLHNFQSFITFQRLSPSGK